MEKHDGNKISYVDIAWLVAGLFVVLVFLFNEIGFFVNIKYYFTSINFASFVSIYKTALTLLALFFMTIIAYTSVRMFEIRKREHEHLHHEMEEFKHKAKEREEKKKKEAFRNPRWSEVLQYISSPNQNDWKLAVIEADSMLEDLLTDLGFEGDSLGEKLKNATQETFKDLTIAWEVHSIRNRVAHEGTAFELSAHEAKRVIALYERIFYNFGFI